jgi:hypothetical protein
MSRKNSNTVYVLMIFLALGAGAIGLRGIQLAGIGDSVYDVSFTVKDEATNMPVPGALILLDNIVWPWQPGVIDFTMETGPMGYASDKVTHGKYVITVKATGYQDLEMGPIEIHEPMGPIPLKITKSVEPPQPPQTVGHLCTIYVVHGLNTPVEPGSVTIEGTRYTTTQEGRVRILQLPPGQYQATVWGRYTPEGYTWPREKTITVGLDMPNRDAIFTVYLDTGILESGIPKQPPPDLSRLGFGLIILAGTLTIGIGILYHGRGPELGDRVTGRR